MKNITHPKESPTVVNPHENINDDRLNLTESPAVFNPQDNVDDDRVKFVYDATSVGKGFGKALAYFWELVDSLNLFDEVRQNLKKHFNHHG